MGLGLGLGLGIGNVALRQKARPPAVPDVLCQAIAQMRVVTATYDGESVSFAPHVVYSPEEGGPLYVDVVFTDAPTVGNRPPALAALEVALLASPALTATEFALHPRLAPVLRRYQNVKCIVQAS